MTDASHDSSITICRAKASDYRSVTALWDSCSLTYRAKGRESEAAFRRQLERFPDLYLVAMDKHHIVGVVLGSHDHRKGWINRVAVLPEYRRRGVATDLVEACDAAIRACGIDIVSALIEEDNEASFALFEKLGYRADIPVRYYRKLSHPEA